MKISKITAARLFNTGNYEHVRYELTVDVSESESASDAIVGLERIMEGLRPIRNVKTDQEIKLLESQIERMLTMPAVEWERQYKHYTGTPTEIIERHRKSLDEEIEKASKAKDVAKRARELLDDIGGASKWTDAKLDWDDEDNDSHHL